MVEIGVIRGAEYGMLQVEELYPLRLMNPAAKTDAQMLLQSVRPGSTTNLSGGLLKGLAHQQELETEEGDIGKNGNTGCCVCKVWFRSSGAAHCRSRIGCRSDCSGWVNTIGVARLRDGGSSFL